MDLLASMRILQAYEPRASVFPSHVDLSACPYVWPICLQPLYAGAMPLIFNATILNGMGVTGHVTTPPTFQARGDNDIIFSCVLFFYVRAGGPQQRPS